MTRVVQGPSGTVCLSACASTRLPSLVPTHSGLAWRFSSSPSPLPGLPSQTISNFLEIIPGTRGPLKLIKHVPVTPRRARALQSPKLCLGRALQQALAQGSPL